jgi:hypothetical protein
LQPFCPSPLFALIEYVTVADPPGAIVTEDASWPTLSAPAVVTSTSAAAVVARAARAVWSRLKGRIPR